VRQNRFRTRFAERTWPGGLREKITTYTWMGLVVGAALALLVSVRLLLLGSTLYVAQLGVPYLVLVLLYLAGGVVTCASLAILERFARSLLSYLVVGVLVALPASVMLAIALAKADSSWTAIVFVATAMAVIYGTIGALLAWRDL
jgi:hypothetical protein